MQEVDRQNPSQGVSQGVLSNAELKLARSVKEIIMLREQLRISQRMESVGLLAAGIAHDQNNVLTAILGASDLLQAYCKSDKRVLRLTEQIITAAEHGAKLARKVLQSVRLDTKMHPVQLGQVVQDVLALLRRSVDPRIEIEMNLESRQSTVGTDPSLLHQVLMNLCINARDAIAEGGRMCVSVTHMTVFEFHHGGGIGRKPDLALTPPSFKLMKDAEILVLEVQDSGRGIDPDVLPKILDPFFTTKTKEHGTGLGLSIVAQVVEECGFLFSVHSEVGHGTRIRVGCPPFIENMQAHAVIEKPAPSQKHAGRVLVVDDEAVVRDTLCEMLEMVGYETVTAQNGREAVDIYKSRKNPFKLIVLDLMMPEMDGMQALKEIRKVNREQAILVMTGYADDKMIQHLRTEVGVPVLFKPFRYDDLLKEVAGIGKH
jgi:two-component system, cell cycle sensor histidine kinase and response regulator CckA